MNYDQLVAQIQAFSNRIDPQFIAQIPNFIQQAIYIIYSKVRTIGFQKIQAGNPAFVANIPLIRKPFDWKETISLAYFIPNSSITYVLPRSYEFCRTYSPVLGVTGDPVFYADYDLPTEALGSIFLSPTPSADYFYELVYLAIPNFSQANQFEFISSRYPSLLLDTCLLRGAIYLKDDERIAMFDARCKDGMAALEKDTTSRYTDRLSRRDKD